MRTRPAGSRKVTMKLAIKKDEGSIPGGGFHYMLHPFRIPDEEAPLWSAIGYQVVGVGEEKGQRLLKEAGDALRHQVEVAFLYERVAPK